MNAKKNFINKSTIIHKNKYDYSSVNYINSYTDVDIICPIHGVFNQRPDGHIRGRGCKKCDISRRTNTTEKFIKKAKLIHGDKYDYSISDYKGAFIPVEIICPIHGVFEQTPHNHIHGRSCKKCKDITKDTKQFIEDATKVHGGEFDYSLVDYKNNCTDVEIICKKHGIFNQTPSNHLQGRGCKKCVNEKMTKKLEVFISEANIIHNNKYDYSLVEYIKGNLKVNIICSRHGVFEQTPQNHLKGQGCPTCNESYGEKIIKKLLEDNNIKFIPQYKFKDCKNVFPLPFDFYLPEYNICIEYDGEQHFKRFRFEKDDMRLETRQKLDKIKNEYCRKNNIHLIRISYIQNIIKELTNQLSL